MPHLKCLACRSRLHRSGSPERTASDICDGCGAPLLLVTELSEIVGFRFVDIYGGPSAGGYARLADRVGEIKAQRAAPPTRLETQP